MKIRLTKFNIVIAALFLVLVAMVSLYVITRQTMDTPNILSESKTIELKPGATIRSLAKQLEQYDLVKCPKLLIFWTRLNGDAKRLQVGEYVINPGTTLSALLDDITSGRVRQYALQLLEGWTFKEFMQAIQDHEAISHELGDLTQQEVLQLLEISYDHPEGLFFPETYYIHKNTRDIDVLKRAHTYMKKHLHDLWEERDQGLPFESPYEALILASIVEKESAVEEERALIAGAFINRLRKNMRLQTDPTVIYGMGENYKGDIRFRDLRKDTPYNTYTRNGLPPTPIAMPSLGAIKAVMHPAKTDYLYFVAFSDNSGRHKFSSTLVEHNKAVDKYQRKK
ncbi:MAG: endolytic transglycosylase MltG [Gammaproteobacteria bacterium]|nr:endolytic transglycosylase MltG [Gammaproteobacteria bacterium]MCK5262205.1 endolytic transglycosylase MltG [Gammaproteobacteria bacterium]